MLTIIFDARQGIPIADGFSQNQARILYRQAEEHDGHEFTTSSSILILAFRYGIHEGWFDRSKIKFMFKGEEIVCDQDAKMVSWPDGFCDHAEKMLFLAVLERPSKVSSMKTQVSKTTFNQLIVQLGADRFAITDAWPSHDQTEVREIPEGQLDSGSTYISLPLTKAQQKFLGGTTATYLRLQLNKI